MTYSISKQELRSFLVRYHSLDNYDHLAGKPGIKKLLRRIGSVQYDPLNVVGRNPDLVFQSRIKDYRMSLLEELLYRERSLIDGFDKEMSIYLTADLPCFTRIRQASIESARRILGHREQDEVLSHLPLIMKEIRKKGALAPRDIKLGPCKENRWGHRQISGAALDYLLTAGELGIYNKKGAQKIYAPIADLLPDKILSAPDPFTGENEFLEWYILRRLGSLGAYWPRNGPGWLGHYISNTGLRQKIIKSLEEKKLIVPIMIPEINETFYICRKDLPILNEKNKYDGAARILAPLDNMLWDRLLLKKVFDFEYTWEVYVPAVKRKYGYYVLPVLYRNSLIARFEPCKYDKGQSFTIKNWWWEPSYFDFSLKIRREIETAIKMGLDNFASYLEADGVKINDKNQRFTGK